jgi:hypothetical protein
MNGSLCEAITLSQQYLTDVPVKQDYSESSEQALSIVDRQKERKKKSEPKVIAPPGEGGLVVIFLS